MDGIDVKVMEVVAAEQKLLVQAFLFCFIPGHWMI